MNAVFRLYRLMPEKLYRFTRSTACFGVLVDEAGLVAEPAPIVRWSAGRPIAELVCRERKRFGSAIEVLVNGRWLDLDDDFDR